MKNLTLRVWPDGSLHVSAPTRTPLTHIESFLTAHTVFIEKTRRRFEEKRALNPPLLLLTGDVLPLWGSSHTVCVAKSEKRYAKAERGTIYLGVKDPGDHTERLQCLADLLDREAKMHLTARVAELAPLFAPKLPKAPDLVFRTMKTKWGVCRPRQGRVTLNRNLVFLPPALVDYVLCHELAHFHHADHSAAFWGYLQSVMSDCKKRRKDLNAFPLPHLATPQA